MYPKESPRIFQMCVSGGEKVKEIGHESVHVVGAQVKSSGTTVPTVPCFHGRHWNCTVGTGIARKCHREVTAAH